MRKKEIRLYNLDVFYLAECFVADSAACKFCDRQRGAAFGNVCSPSGKPDITLEKKHCLDLADWLSQRFYRCGAYLSADACFGLAKTAV